MKLKLEEIQIKILGKDRNYNYTLEPEEEIKKIDDAISYLEGMKDEVEEVQVPF